ncbi:hypothetical protein BDR04DRAFT_689803 [Suillus decipiens]|nr:hypothetical protein BDR04DRAFT_689803 [Suillus decipiens]
MHGRPDTMVPHLNSCDKQPENVHTHAHAVCIEKGWIKTPKPPHEVYSLNTPPFSGHSPEPSVHQLNSFGHPSLMLLAQSFTPMVSSTSANVLQQPFPSPLIGLFDGGSGVDSSSSSQSWSPLLLSVPPRPSWTNSPTLGEGSRPSSKWVRILSPQWTPVLQERFETHVIC